ncbi:MAG: hypothetical protein HON47_00460 [Candidatus Diapherotrites archaeon]|jgi:hypothetical protein|uniref:Uncharacterized protein n=1 Tax=Candidatus Iainarchaeum sp. TaxID=3101447 RepID=A0A8T5GDN2_9ARCH|nr:hypothetical protein [Candidatus Diapherotrites archaeon]MBT7241715.1 hypothetical protein [Candidatus Diapherotrites archaeon]
MKIAVSEDTDVKKVPKDTEEIHLVRPIKKENLDFLLKNRPIKKISLSSSCLKRLPKKAQIKIKERGIEISVEKKRGRALDLTMEQMLEIIELRKDYQSIREIEKVMDIPKSTVHYLLKYADRGKVKKGSTIMYLK